MGETCSTDLSTDRVFCFLYQVHSFYINVHSVYIKTSPVSKLTILVGLVRGVLTISVKILTLTIEQYGKYYSMVSVKILTLAIEVRVFTTYHRGSAKNRIGHRNCQRLLLLPSLHFVEDKRLKRRFHLPSHIHARHLQNHWSYRCFVCVGVVSSIHLKMLKVIFIRAADLPYTSVMFSFHISSFIFIYKLLILSHYLDAFLRSLLPISKCFLSPQCELETFAET